MSSFLDNKFAIVDTETTGLIPGVDDVIQVCIYHWEKVPSVNDMRRAALDPDYVHPDFTRYNCKIQPSERGKNILTSVDWFIKNSPYDEELWNAEALDSFPCDEIEQLLDGALIFGQNPGFDVDQIKAQYDKRVNIGRRMLDLQMVSWLALFNGIEPPRNNSLDNVCDFLGIDKFTAHDAEGDVKRTILAYCALVSGFNLEHPVKE